MKFAIGKSLVMRRLYAIVAAIGLVGVAAISYGQFTGASECPNVGEIRICYIILACYSAVFFSVFVRGTGKRWLFWPGWIGIFAPAAFGSSMEIAGNDTCPRSGTGIPTCYFSLLMAVVIIVLYLMATRRPNS